MFSFYLIPVITLPFLLHAAFFIEETQTDRNLKNHLQVLGLVLSFMGSFTLVSLNVMIYYKLNQVRNIEISGPAKGERSFRIVLFIASSTIVMYSAFFIYHFIKWDKVCGSKILQRNTYTVVVYLFVLNSSFNFFIYNWTGRKFRKILSQTWLGSKVKALITSACSLLWRIIQDVSETNLSTWQMIHEVP